MARTPKAASTPAAPPAPRGRKPKASAALPEPAAATSGDEAEATMPDAAPAPDSAPKGRGGRKPKKQAAAPGMLPLPEADEASSGEAQPAAADDAMGDTMAADMAYPVSPAEDAAPAEAAEPGQASEPPAEAASAQPASVQSAARWDRATDTVQFDWPAIEQTASQAGPNQAMAKLLVAARAEGASSRWPF